MVAPNSNYNLETAFATKKKKPYHTPHSLLHRVISKQIFLGYPKLNQLKIPLRESHLLTGPYINKQSFLEEIKRLHSWTESCSVAREKGTLDMLRSILLSRLQISFVPSSPSILSNHVTTIWKSASYFFLGRRALCKEYKCGRGLSGPRTFLRPQINPKISQTRSLHLGS